MFFNFQETNKKSSCLFVENIGCIKKSKETDTKLRAAWQADPNIQGQRYYAGPVIPDNQEMAWIMNAPDGKCTGYSLKNKKIEILQFAGRITPELVKP